MPDHGANESIAAVGIGAMLGEELVEGGGGRVGSHL
jgi:hypothetical protein